MTRDEERAIARRVFLERLLDEDPGICECGTPLDIHPPLVAPGPLRSWKSQRDLAFPSGASAGLGDRDEALVEAQRRRRRA